MDNFGMLYRFELKKLWKKKMVRCTLVILLGVVIMININELLFATHKDDWGRTIREYEYAAETRDYALRMSGRAIDDTFIAETQRAYGDSIVVAYEKKEKKNSIGLVTSTLTSSTSLQNEEDKRDAEQVIEDHKKYLGIYSYLASIAGYMEMQYVDADGLYQLRQDLIKESYLEKQKLTEKERSVWTEREEKLEKPFVYEYCEGFMRLFMQGNLLSYLWILLSAVSLSGIFAEEYRRGTDQLILCCKYGKTPFYLAKLCAGATLAAGGFLLFFATAALLSLGIYGADGFHAALQMVLWMSPWDISIGKAVVILFFISLAAVVLCSVLTMFLSLVLKSGIAALSIMAGTTLLSVFLNVPERLRGLSMLCSLLPTKLLAEQGFYDNRLIFVFGHGFYGMEAAPVLYLLFALAFVWAGRRIYCR